MRGTNTSVPRRALAAGSPSLRRAWSILALCASMSMGSVHAAYAAAA